LGRKLICYSLYASDRRPFQVYAVGAIENQKTYRDFYPDFQTRFYIAEYLRAIGEPLRELGAEVIYERDLPGHGGLMWRLRPLVDGDFDIALFRDADSRLSMREKNLVDAFVASDKGYHIIKDHPGHNFRIHPGMFGAKKINPQLQAILRAKLFFVAQQVNSYGFDERFLQHEVYDCIKADVLLHDSRINPELFTDERKGFYIGMPVDERGREIEVTLDPTLLSSSGVTRKLTE
jgi:hypothetical protein